MTSQLRTIALLVLASLCMLSQAPTSLAQAQKGQPLAFASDRTGRFQVWVGDSIPSGAVHQVTTGGGGNQESREPNWSKNGRIVYQFGAPSVRGLHLIKPDGTGDVALLHTGGDDRDPWWSPDGRFIVFASQPPGARDYDIWIYDTNGTLDDTSDDKEYVLLNRPGLEDLAPTWSPDFNSIAFVTSGSSPQIASVPIKIDPSSGQIVPNGSVQMLTNNAFRNFDPSWSPDSQQIAYATTRNGNWDIYRMSAISGEANQTQLTTNSANDTNPAWSFDGTTITFSSDRVGNLELYRMDATLGEADRADLIEITGDPSQNDDSAWAATINVSRLSGNQSEEAVAINPKNPKNVVIVSNESDSANALFRAFSTDGGVTWKSNLIANGDSLGVACCDPSIAFDQFGNLFLAFLDSDFNIRLGLSTDGGQTFRLLKTFETVKAKTPAAGAGSRTPASVDQPTVVTAPPGPTVKRPYGSVWITYADALGIEATGARVTGRGLIGTFIATQLAPGSAGGNFGDIAIGPKGQVLVTYQNPSDRTEPSNIYVNLKPDGLGPMPFNAATLVTSTNVGGFHSIPAQFSRGIDAEAGLAWDRGSDPHKGRVYLVYTDAPTVGSDDTNIFVRFSDNDGSTWSTAVRVNDDTGTNSQFLPRIALDQTQGTIAVSWHDCRNDLGDHHLGDTNGIPNDDAQFFAALSFDGVTFRKNIQVAAGTSNAADAPPPDPCCFRLDGSRLLWRKFLPSLGRQLKQHRGQSGRGAFCVRYIYGTDP
jgi:dipeptidyl aminopeptidase/acylaminoacyl peptidase